MDGTPARARHKHANKYNKTKLCMFFAAGYCRHGAYCNFAHGPQDLRVKPPLWTRQRLQSTGGRPTANLQGLLLQQRAVLQQMQQPQLQLAPFSGRQSPITAVQPCSGAVVSQPFPTFRPGVYFLQGGNGPQMFQGSFGGVPLAPEDGFGNTTEVTASQAALPAVILGDQAAPHTARHGAEASFPSSLHARNTSFHALEAEPELPPNEYAAVLPPYTLGERPPPHLAGHAPDASFPDSEYARDTSFFFPASFCAQEAQLEPAPTSPPGHLSLSSSDSATVSVDSVHSLLVPEPVDAPRLALFPPGSISRGKELSSGSFGTVYTGRMACGKRVAVKECKNPTTKAAQLLRREAVFMAAAKHPYVLACEGLLQGDEPLRPYVGLVMEEGEGDLLDLVTKLTRPLRAPEVASLMLGPARAIAHMHSMNMVHADIKRENLIIGSGNRVLVGDLGSAQMVGAGGGSVYAGGTPRCRSPQIIDGDEPTPADDVWVCMYELWLVRDAFPLGMTGTEEEEEKEETGPDEEKKAIEAVENAICRDKLLPDFPPDADEQLMRLIEFCLRPGRAERPTFEQIVRVLEDLASQDPGAADSSQALCMASMSSSVDFGADCMVPRYRPGSSLDGARPDNPWSIILSACMPQGSNSSSPGSSELEVSPPDEASVDTPDLPPARIGAQFPSESSSSSGEYRQAYTAQGSNSGGCSSSSVEVQTPSDTLPRTGMDLGGDETSSLRCGVYIDGPSGPQHFFGDGAPPLMAPEVPSAGVNNTEAFLPDRAGVDTPDLFPARLAPQSFSASPPSSGECRRASGAQASGSSTHSSTVEHLQLRAVHAETSVWVCPVRVSTPMEDVPVYPADFIKLDEKPLATGGCGKVYRGRTPGGVEVVVKVPLEQWPYFQGLLREEARFMLAAKHDYVLECLGLLESSDPAEPFTGLIVGAGECDLLHRVVWGEELKPTDVARMMAGPAHALARLHERRIVHGDVKLNNFIVMANGDGDGDGNVVLSDFGSAQVVDDPHAPAVPGRGAHLYRSPEAVARQSPTSADDVWALGMTLYVMASRQPPFKGTPEEVEAKIRARKLPPLPAEWPVEFQLLLKACWHPCPDERPTMAFIAECLKRMQP